MCNACYQPGELEKEAVANAVEEARMWMGPRELSSGPEQLDVERYVAGWHDALDYLEKKGEFSE
jgi:hypothetical protein